MVSFINRGIQFVDDNVRDVFVFGVIKVRVCDFNVFFQLCWVISIWSGNEYNFCIESVGDFCVYLVSKRVFMCWNQIFDQSYFCIFVDLVVMFNYGFQQNVYFFVIDQSFGGRYIYWLVDFDVVVVVYDSRCQVRLIIVSMWLCDRFIERNVNFFMFYGVQEIYVYVGQIDVSVDWDKYNSMGYW